MAKDKKSFVAYADWNTTFEKLSDEEAGKLAKMMFSFVSDQNPEAPDRMTELLFDPIKNQLKRDLKSYEKTLDEKSRRGRLGNLKRWSPDLYDKVVSELIELEEAESIAKHRTSDKNIAQATKSSLNIADTDNVDDTVIDNDTVTDILLEKETKGINLSDKVSEDVFPDDKILDAEKEKSCAKKEKFKPPSVDDVQKYCNERQNDIQAFKFVNFYQSKGWKVGNQPMKDWQAAIRTWEQKNKENGQSKTATTLTQAARR